MVKRTHIVAAAGILVTSAAAIFATEIGMPIPAFAHEDRGHFSAGEPGDPKKPARTIKVIMREDGKKMAFDPARITVRKGEQIRFVLENDGTDDHEFVLASAVENRKHAELMKKFPDIEHDDPNAKRLAVGEHVEILWKVTKTVTFQFACLIPVHLTAGMLREIVVK